MIADWFSGLFQQLYGRRPTTEERLRGQAVESLCCDAYQEIDALRAIVTECRSRLEEFDGRQAAWCSKCGELETGIGLSEQCLCGYYRLLIGPKPQFTDLIAKLLRVD